MTRFVILVMTDMALWLTCESDSDSNSKCYFDFNLNENFTRKIGSFQVEISEKLLFLHFKNRSTFDFHMSKTIEKVERIAAVARVA